MPFKLRLRKSRQYAVASRRLVVAGVELPDGGVLECTLARGAAAAECAAAVCARAGVGRPELWALRARAPAGWRWLRPGRPLRRQLERLAARRLQLRLLHYLPAGQAPRDEPARYHYFLQLKSDLLEGRLVCDCRTAVVLAAYGRQAEYGNHDAERHTVEYLKNLLCFPKRMKEGNVVVDGTRLTDSQLEYLAGAVIQHHQTLRNLSQAHAEEGFINTCQTLPGYGQETFTARDVSRQNDVEVSISLTGITLLTKNTETPKFYRWTDIRNVINHKRNFSIECQNPTENASVVFETAEDGKYVWRMCVLQHTFFTNLQQNSPNQNSVAEQLPQPKFQNDGLNDSRDDLDCIALNKEGSASVPGLLDVAELKPLSYGGSQQELSQPLSNSQRALSTSCLDLTVSNSNLQSQHDLDKLRALLPSYRPAPDYDTAVQQKYGQQPQPAAHFANTPHSPIHQNPINAAKPLVYGSQPEIHRPIHYPDVTRHTSMNRPIRQHDEFPYGLSAINTDGYTTFPVDNGLLQSVVHQPVHYLNVYKPPPPYPSNGLVSNSTPDLAVASQSINSTGYHRNYISPHVSGSSPDLVSSRTFLSRQYLSRLQGGNPHNLMGYFGIQNVIPPAHGTYENLATVMDTPNRHIIIEAPHLTNHIQKVYDERGNIMYCVPATQVPYRKHMVLQHQKLNAVQDSQEPIYENVPLPWQNETVPVPVRNRAYSFTSTPDISRVAERKVSQPTSVMMHSQNNQPTIATGIHPGFPQTLQNTPPKLPSDNHYANAHIIKATNPIVQLNENKIHLNSKTSSKTNLQDITSSFKSLSVSKDKGINNEVECDVSLKGSITGLNIAPNPMIQKSDNNNVTTITINASENLPFGYGKTNSFGKKSIHTDISNSNTMYSEISGQNSGLDFSMPTSSFFDTTQSTTCDLESSGISTSTNGSVQGKEKKKRRWMIFGGRSHKTDVKSATLGRDKEKKNQGLNESNEKHRWSTALPKLQPLPPSISKEAMCQLLERKMADAQLSFTFERIPKGRDNNTDMTTALNPDNSYFNAGCNEYLPYEDNRVRLTPTKMNKHGYINASHITATVGSSQRFYIACSIANHGNNASVITATFWQAVWETGARVIAFISNNLNPDHLPEQFLVGKTKDYGQYQVFVESSQSSEHVVTSRLRLMNGKMGMKNTGTMGQMRTIWHLQYTEWPDNMIVPRSTEHFLGFLEELSAVRQHCASIEITPLHNANPPVFIVCLQGSGRTGVSIAADLLLYTLEHNQELDIQRVIGLLHQQRANLLQNVHQYRFIHGLLIYYLKQTRLI